MAAAHANLLPLLSGNPGKAFIVDLTQRIYDWAERIPTDYYKYRFFTEVSIRIATGEKTRLGLDRNKHYRFDAIFFVEPGMRALNQHQIYSVGMELKNSREDLMHDSKMENYLGYTDFFFIGVPEALAQDALKRAEGNAQIGVVDIDNGIIYKLPKRIEVTPIHRLEIYEQILYGPIFEDIKTISFEAKEVEIVTPDFKELGIPESSAVPATPSTNIEAEVSKRIEEQKEAEAVAAEQHKEELEAKKENLAASMTERRKNLPDNVLSTIEQLPLKEQQVYCIIQENTSGIQVKDITENLGDDSSDASVKRYISHLKDLGLIERLGSKKTGVYSAVSDYICRSECSACARSKYCKDFKVLKAQ